MKIDSVLKYIRTNTWFIIKIELILVVVWFATTQFPNSQYYPAFKEAVALATTQKPETFTELYFEDHITLPKTIVRYEKYNFAFTLHNVEFKETSYKYEVYLQRESEKIILDEGNITLKEDEFKTIQQEFGPLKNIRAKIVVNLIDKNQSIHFWMEPK